MVKYILIFLISTFIITSCSAPKKIVNLNSVFDEEEAKRILEDGNNTIKGSAVIRQAGGTVVTCAGCEVLCYPATDYAQERINVIYGNTEKAYKKLSRDYSRPENRNKGYFDKDPKYVFIPDYEKYHYYRKKSIGNSQGFFEFENLKDGNYFIITTIVWGFGYPEIYGGTLMLRVEIRDGETKKIVLAP